MSKVEKEYEEVATDDNVPTCDDHGHASYGYGIRHVQCIIIFVCLCVLIIARAHLSVTIVAMTDISGLENKTKDLKTELSSSNLYLQDVSISRRGTQNIGGLSHTSNATNNYKNRVNPIRPYFKDINNASYNFTENYIMTNDSEAKGNETNELWNVYRIYPWPKSTQEMVLGAFFLGYMIMMSPMGMVAQRFGGKLPLQIALVASGIISLLTPWLAVWGNYTAVCVSRLAMGLLQAGTYPSILQLIAKWVPVSERGRLGTYTYLGSFLGSVLSYHMSGLLSTSRFSWPSVFWVTGILCLITALVLTVFVATSPLQHRFISLEERNYILGSQKTQVEKRLPTPWRAILSSRAVWATFIAHIGANNCYIFFFNQIPTYMHFIVGFNIKSSGLLSSLPYIANIVFSMIMGHLADFLLNNETLTLKQVRVISNNIAQIIPALCLFAVSFTSSPAVAVVLLVLCMGTHGANHTGWLVNYIDLSPHFSGTLMATGNTLANFAGVLLPVMISFVVTDLTNVYQWRIMLFIVGMLSLVTNVIFVIFMSADVQPWDSEYQINKRELKYKSQEQKNLQRI